MSILSAEQREIRSLAREFARGEIRPHSQRWDAGAALDDDIFSSLAELGFLGMLAPEARGGLDLDVPTYLLVLQELAWGDAAVALTVAIHNGPVTGLLAAHGTDEQRSRWLPGLAAGEVLGAFSLSEEGAGSDAGALETRAARTGGGWVLTGSKKWVTNGARAGLVLTFARTDEGIGCFVVEPSSDGYEVVERATTMGLRASETVHVRLDGVRVEGDALVGDPGRGLAYALEALDLGRAGVAAQALGVARAAKEHATGYALERRQFGRALVDFGAVQAKLAGMAARIASSRGLIREVGERLQARREGRETEIDDGADSVTVLAALAKLTASEAAMWVTDEAVQIYGGYGYMRDYPVEKLMRDAKGTEIYEGTNEIMRMLVARELIRAARGDTD